LGWRTVWPLDTALGETAGWYQQLRHGLADARSLCEAQIARFTQATQIDKAVHA
jgi:CDP-glucose 4,6-dehydratase